MKSSDYSILATSERFRDITAFWRQRLAALDDSTPLAPTSSATAASRKSIAVQLDARAVRALDTMSNDSLGRFTVLTAAIALGVARYFNRSATLLRTPLLIDDAEPALNSEREVALVFTAPPAQSLREFIHDAAGLVAESYSFQDYPVHALFETEGVRAAHEKLAKCYAKVGAPDHFKSIIEERPHEFNAERQAEAWAWFDKWL